VDKKQIICKGSHKSRTNKRNTLSTAPDLGGKGARAQGLPSKDAPHHVHMFGHVRAT